MVFFLKSDLITAVKGRPVESKGSDGNKAAERQTQKRVLQLLQQIGPTSYNLLFLQFELHNGFLQGAVDELLHGNSSRWTVKKWCTSLTQVTVFSMT
jgi:hypothetical protein